MGAYGNTMEECIAKIMTYRNPDARCTYPFTPDPVGYCWAYAHHVDGNPKFADMDKICPGCECWKKEQERDGAHANA